MARSFDPWQTWANAMQVGWMMTEAQMVMTMRLMGMAGLWSVSPREERTMVTEKIAAATTSWMNMQTALLRGATPPAILAAGLRPVRARTRANARRLSRRGPRLKP